ncbi:o-succinylbenzoate synthase [Reichenbachiella versicolor]|uniref:o-succinylbenzoate synthase n=1 Tax=Reichenbachiella versicolor TaxID=1821036 RepID=UPI000D6E18E0|nr:o-succinylbenzoate synthase [Reichenbachiella versicolor]
MPIKLTFVKHILNFKFDAGTSRGVLKTKDAWILKVSSAENLDVFGLGEVSVIERLSYDYNLDFDWELNHLAELLEKESVPKSMEDIYPLIDKYVDESKPAIRFGLETALMDLINGGQRMIYDNGFFQDESGIPINGLIWMGDESFMKEQVESKLKAGFTCIKMKIGAIDFDKECKILSMIRKEFPADQLTLRVDANGAFDTQTVLMKLNTLEEFDLHSIEQPIMPKQEMAMQLLCQKNIVPIALDEELIGVFGKNHKRRLLEEIKPQYIILKPSLLGGLKETAEWIKIAESMEIGWWVTSALESNVGLNAICQFVAEYDYVGHQGLGTGQLYDNNFHSPLAVIGEQIFYKKGMTWDFTDLDFA